MHKTGIYTVRLIGISFNMFLHLDESFKNSWFAFVSAFKNFFFTRNCRICKKKESDSQASTRKKNDQMFAMKLWKIRIHLKKGRVTNLLQLITSRVMKITRETPRLTIGKTNIHPLLYWTVRSISYTGQTCWC